MCGLVGIISRKPSGFTTKIIETFETMLKFDALRGHDSTGVLCAKSTGSVDVLKVAEEPYFLFRSTQWEPWKNRAFGTGRILAGHNRAATRGTINNDNAHPFVEKHIVMMHNGTLNHGWESLAKDVKLEVDSHAICHALTEDVPEKIIPQVSGAFALMWYNLETEEFYAVRNSERPLVLTVTDDFYFLSSEAWMATVPCMRAGIKIQNSDMIPEGQLFTWDLKGNLKEPVAVRLDEDTTMRQAYREHVARHGSSFYDDDLEPVLPNAGGAKVTQIQFPTAPTIRKVEEAPRAGCALTTTTTKDCSENSTATKALEDLSKVQSTITVLSEQFPRDMEVLVKILNISQMNNGTWRWTGKIHSPGKELVDAMGYLARNVSATELPEWMEFPIHAKVGWVTATSGGLTVVCKETQMTEITLTAMGKPIPKVLWEHAHWNCKCRDCNREVGLWEKEFTSVKLKTSYGDTMSGNPKNTLEMVCADCIMKGMEDKVREKFSKSYYAKQHAAKAVGDSSVQNRQSVSSESGASTGEVPTTANGETLQ